MPGHKGKAFLGAEPWDITEIDGADVLYSADGIIKKSEDLASSLFHTAHTFYSAEGSSLAIKAMLMLVAQNAENHTRPLILAARNAHKAFLYGAALLDIEVEWIYPDPFTHLCLCEITAEAMQMHLKKMPRKPCAVYITSPDYLGRIADIRALSAVCREFSVPLLVDNAHGAYLNFLSPSMHPITLGAWACCDSAHKTLPVLTGGAYLHISKNADPEYLTRARDAMALFSSTSPSYLILQSLDLCNTYLEKDFADELKVCSERVKATKEKICSLGFTLLDSEPLKIVVNAAASGYTGDELADILREHGVECEFADGEFIVLMASPKNTEADFERLERAFESIAPKAALPHSRDTLCRAKQKMSVREAVLSSKELIDVKLSSGRICAELAISCPPAVPVAVCGEVITEDTVALLQKYGVEKIKVVK